MLMQQLAFSFYASSLSCFRMQTIIGWVLRGGNMGKWSKNNLYTKSNGKALGILQDYQKISHHKNGKHVSLHCAPMHLSIKHGLHNAFPLDSNRRWINTLLG
jgi:hypothetical protein